MYCLSSFCCVCLSTNTELLNLNKLDEDGIPIINKLIFIAFGHEKLDLDVTKLICVTCVKDLRIAYRFKTTCLTSNELLIGYNSQLKYFTGSIGFLSDLEIIVSDKERVLSDKKSQEKVKKVQEKRYKPRPLSKQKKHFIKQEKDVKVAPSFKCKHCNETFTSGMRRLIHFNKTHHKNLRKNKKNVTITSEKPKSVCSMCQKSFVNAKVLKCHVLKVHFNDSKLFCRHCNHHFGNRKCFINHMKLRHNYNNFTCEICNLKYLKEINYNKHMAMHAANKITKKKRATKTKKEDKKLKMITRYLVCNTCDEIFINSAQLRRHMVSHGKSSFSIDNTFENGPNDSDNDILRQILSHPPAFTNDNLFETPPNDLRISEFSSELSENIEILPEIKLEPIVEIKEEVVDEPQDPFNFSLPVNSPRTFSVPVNSSGTFSLPVTSSGTFSLPVTSSGTFSLPVTSSGTLNLSVTSSGTFSPPVTSSGTLNLPVTSSGTFSPPVTSSGTLNLPVTSSGTFIPPVSFPLTKTIETPQKTSENSNNNASEAKDDDDSSDSSEIEVEKYGCNICNKQFTVKSFLNAHLLIHNNASGPNFDCIQCKANFTDKKEFAEHILSNTCMSLHPTKSFSCGICFKLFKHEFSLNQHLRTH